MLFGQVQAFSEVARTGNVSRAAESLYVTQPALTARIQALEKELGETLFVRTGRGVRLTDAGRVFLPNAERAVQSIEDGRQALSDLRSASAGRLALGAAPAVSTYVLPPVLKRFANLHPRVDVAVSTGHSEEILAMVEEVPDFGELLATVMRESLPAPKKGALPGAPGAAAMSGTTCWRTRSTATGS